MKKYAAIAIAAVIMLSVPVSGMAAVSLDKHSKLYNTEKYLGDELRYSTAAIKLSKKDTRGKEYIKADMQYPKINGYTDVIAKFNAQNKENMRKQAEDFINEYLKDAKKYYETNGSLRSVKSEPDYALDVKYTLKFNDNSVISVLYTVTTTIAGDRSVEYFTQNYDFVTGKELTPDDVSVIPQKGETMKLALDMFNSKIRNNKRIYEQVQLTKDDVEFYFEDNKIVFFVDPGVISDENRGMISLELLDDTARSYLWKKVK